MHSVIWLLAAVCCALGGLQAAAAQGEKRVALVIGNAAYRSVGELVNPTKDARDVAAAFRAAGFSEVVERYNLGVQQMRDVLAAFEDKTAGADWAVVYYAGHGIEADRRNYLVPIDAQLKRAGDVEDEALPLDRVLARVSAAGKLQLVILDACRDNPFKARMAGVAARSVGTRGLARVEPIHPNVLVAYAARDGEVALDGPAGGNGPYAKALAKYLAEPGLEVGSFFRKVRDDVLAATAGQQRPFEYGSLTGQQLYFRAPTAMSPDPSVSSGPSRTEVAQFCQSVAANTSLAVVEALLAANRGSAMAPGIAAGSAAVRNFAGAAPSAPPPPKSPPPPASYTDGVVKIGVMNDQSGVYADLSGQGSVWAARKAVVDFCKGNACHDSIEVVVADHQNKPDVGSTVVRRLYDVDKVDVVVDVPTSTVALAVNTIATEKNKVLLVSGAATADLTGKACTANTVHWTYDTWALASGAARAVVKTGGQTWFFLTADYGFGHALERETAAFVEKAGGKVVGRARHPFPGGDFSSYLLQAQVSKAKIIGLANAGSDTINAIKQAREFGTAAGGQNLAGLLMFITDVHALGLETAQGLLLAEAWYWDASDANREFSREFAAANKGNRPTMMQAGVYSAVTHYLKAVHALRSDADGAAVVAKMKEMSTEDRLFGKGSIRRDGRKLHPMYLFEVKRPADSKGPWDYYKLRAIIPAEEAFRPLADGGCPLAK